MASDNVHANAHGAYFRLGSPPRGEDVLLAGPSFFGLADPGDSTAVSLCQVTASMLGTNWSLDSIVAVKILLALRDEIGEAFIHAHEALEGLEGDGDYVAHVD